MASGILHNAYMKPDYKRPYFYINNVNTTNVADLDGDNTPIAEVRNNAVVGAGS
jgi:hypothetical protein